MNWPMLQHGFTIGHYLWVVSAVVAGLTLSTQATAAKECARETPVPADVRLIAPGPEVPEALARFAGVWIGAWLDKGNEALCHTLVVEQVHANGFARVIFSEGTYVDWNIRLPDVWRVTGRIVDGELRFHLPVSERPKLAYRVAGETLQGTWEGSDGSTERVSLTRVADLSQVGCGPEAGGLPPVPPGTGPRDRLTTAELLTGADPGTSPVHNAYFLPVGQAAPALHPFTGTVTVPTSTMLRARHGCPGLAETFPGFTVAFITQGEYLVPLLRDILNPHLPVVKDDDPRRQPGTLILSSGQVWSEPGDGGMSRASFPFVLVNQTINATHNGLATFLYDDARVSTFRFQLVQESATWAKFDGWGQAPMTYTPGPIADEAAVRAPFVAELQHQTPIRPWSAVPVSSGVPGLEGFDGDAAPDDVGASGLIVDGVLYLRGCETRWGPYPYCRHMRHGVFSVTKSLGAAVPCCGWPRPMATRSLRSSSRTM
jgi:hypothetical protein